MFILSISLAHKAEYSPLKVIALVSVLAYWGMRARIPFASLLLQVVMDVAKHHKSVYVVAFIALLVQAALAVWYVFTTISM